MGSILKGVHTLSLSLNRQQLQHPTQNSEGINCFRFILNT